MRQSTLPSLTDAILTFWFGDASSDADVITAKGGMWFRKDPQLDNDIRTRFADALSNCATNSAPWYQTSQTLLAAILLCDQFSRNIHRDTPQAFAYDQLARRFARYAVDNGIDNQWRPIARVFGALPFEHSESLCDQFVSLALFSTLVDAVDESLRETFQHYYHYAHRHYEIIVQFGRFPHRNAVLGRQTTAAEATFLQTPNSSF